MSTKRKGTDAPTGKPAKKVPIDTEKTLAKVRELRDKERDERPETALELSHLNLEGAFTEVAEMEDETVKEVIERIALHCCQSILAGQGYTFNVPLRTSANQVYVPELDRLVLKEGYSARPFGSIANVRKTAITTRILQLVHEVVNKRIHITKRDLFYTDVKLFQNQRDSDTVIDDVACMIGCTRSSLNVVASEKGVVVGRMKFRDDGDLIDCTKMGVGGKVIPGLIDRVSDISGDAEFILLVEKDAIFMRLSEDRFYNTYPCVIITAKGQPDIATRLFLKRVKNKLQIPILGLFDSDPYGLKILSVYMSGSKNMSYDSSNLTTSDIRWLGVRPSDLDRYNIPKECRLDMTESDIKTGKELLKEDFIQKNPAWVRELELMLKTKQKAEIQALTSFGFQYLTQEYLPRKMASGDWI
eukprot:comp23455_c0_seq1/m.39160 comp23455_c0_seq1/g.39160  ORF comp23455_c0_seq1/g.39160 comp23455_c0_seq1/m.39160 type:complete len:415 (-) comp23455_c0_seq1:121-1365(-)